MHKTISITNGVARMPEWRMKTPVNFCLMDNEQLAIIGDNAAGKSMLVEMITGRHPLLSEKSLAYDFGQYTKRFVSDNIKYIRFCDCYGGDTDRGYYLQQRWNQAEISDDTMTVGEKLERAYRQAGADTEDRRRLRDYIYQLFGIDNMLDKYVILLSSGELRKLTLAENLFGSPRMLMIDNPFIGLDAETRTMLSELLKGLCDSNILQIVLVLSRPSDIPDFITHVIEVKDMVVLDKKTKAEYLQSHDETTANALADDKRQAIMQLHSDNMASQCKMVAQMNNITIRYGKHTILKDVNWTLRNGERWALTGRNGSGKSTLLSILCADNPQSYACDVTLFDKKRGSGESIWDIKKHIGYVSPEMHRALRHDIAAINIVATGLNGSFGIRLNPKGDNRDKCLFWMGVFGISHVAERSFLKLSSGEQRLALLARAFVSDPDLLILDEPLHGLDERNKRLANDVIDTFCQRPNKTLVYVSHYRDEFPQCIDHELQLKKPQQDKGEA